MAEYAHLRSPLERLAHPANGMFRCIAGLFQMCPVYRVLQRDRVDVSNFEATNMSVYVLPNLACVRLPSALGDVSVG